jgi:purine-binding chemotaxis protein CheW
MSATPTTCQLVVCSLGAEEYALPIEQVREIVRASDPRPVVSGVPSLRGVISLRGRLLPVHDLAARLGVASAAGEQAKIVVAEAGEDELAGLVVDDVVEVVTVALAQIEEVPDAHPDGRPARIAKLGERLVAVLDAGELLAEARLPDAEDPERAPAAV